MNIKEKTERVISLRMAELLALDRDITKLIFVLLGAWGVFFLTLYKLNLLENNTLIGILIGSIVSIVYVGEQYNRYISDCYDWLVIAIKDNKILKESMPLMKIRDAFFYKKRYIIA